MFATHDNRLVPKINIYYYPEENVFRTADDKIIPCLFPIVSPNDLLLFRQHRKTVEIVNTKYGLVVNLLFPIN